MELKHEFTVPASIEETWDAFNDIESVAACFPGATVTSVEGDSFQGSCKVKLGPIALVYNGSGTFVEKDESARRMVIDAKGKDKRGNGTAGATVTLTMAPVGSTTEVEVVTDLSITGKPAQFGRGVMQDVSDKLLGQFVDCLEQRLSGPPEAVVPDDRVAEMPPGPPEGPGVSEVPAPKHAAEPPPPAPRPVQQDDSLDLGAAVLPVLARTYWKQAAGVVLALLLLRWVVSRSRR